MCFKYFLIISFFLCSVFSFAQRKDHGFKSGITAGVVFSQVDGDSFSGYQKLGLQCGIFSKYIINDKFNSHVEIKYIQKGSKRVNPKNGVFFDFKLDYIDIPLMVIYYINKITFLDGGLGIAYLFNAKVDPDAGGFADAFEIYEGLKKYEFSLILGGGYYFSDKWMVNARYSYSILPFLPHPGGQMYYTDMGCYNNLVGATLNYIF
ncbi:MAG: porin family protein [Bacteroidota bacterium]